MISVMLERFDKMNVKDSKKAFLIYLNFIKVNKEIRKMAQMVVTEFKINMNIYFYDVDTKLIQALKQEIDIKMHENSSGSQRDQY